MWFLYALSWVSLVVQVCFITLSIAAGLYYLAEFVEEYTILSKKIIRILIFITFGIYVGLALFENLPRMMLLCGGLAQIPHLRILQTFPYVYLSSPSFILAVVMLVVNHYMAFSYFASTYYNFSELMAYFTLCLWLVPSALFVSLSANENVLPTVTQSRLSSDNDNDVITNYFSRKERKYGLLSLFKYAKQALSLEGNKKSF